MLARRLLSIALPTLVRSARSRGLSGRRPTGAKPSSGNSGSSATSTRNEVSRLHTGRVKLEQCRLCQLESWAGYRPTRLPGPGSGRGRIARLGRERE